MYKRVIAFISGLLGAFLIFLFGSQLTGFLVDDSSTYSIGPAGNYFAIGAGLVLLIFSFLIFKKTFEKKKR